MIDDHIKITIAWPTRNRPDLCIKCITSFYQKAFSQQQIETVMVMDYDDKNIPTILEFINQHLDWNIKTVIRHRSPFLIRDYVNLMARTARGQYIWGLNDECEVVTDHWDNVLNHYCDTFLSDKPDRIMYALIDDDTHSKEVSSGYGCCFPLVSREWLLASECYLPFEIVNQGGDVALYRVFQHTASDRILDLRDHLKTLHHSSHNGRQPLDVTQSDMDNVARQYNKSNLNDEEMARYAAKISSYRSRF